MSYLNVNGLCLYYEEHGDGEPLIMLHGGLHTGEIFGSLLPEFTRHRRVILADLEAHGRTADIGRPLRYATMADDLAGLIRHLGPGQADVVGYSLGGGAALRLAIQHPALVRRLVLLATPCKRTGWFPEVLAGFDAMGAHLAEPFKASQIYEVYSRVAPRAEDWPVLLDRAGELLRQDYDWTGEITRIAAPVMLVYGDADSIRPEHIVEFYQLLGGGQRDAHWDGSLRPSSRLAVLPGQIHTDILTAPGLAAAVNAFLDERVLVPPSQEPAQP